MPPPPFVSVIVPVFNGANFVRRCINSLANQTYRNFEIIAINDASTDSSLEELHSLETEHTELKVVDKQMNGGVHAARLDGIKTASGDYLAFADADDWADSDMLENLIKPTTKTNVDIVVGGAMLVDRDGKRLGYKAKFKDEEIINPLAFSEFCQLRLGTGALWNKLIKKDLVLKYAEQDFGWRPDAVEDTLILIGCFAEARKTVTISGSLYNYVQHETAATKIAGNALSYSRILRAYASAIETYQYFDENKLNLIDELYRKQLNMPVYHVFQPEALRPHVSLLEPAIKILANNRPSALYQIANIGIFCPSSKIQHKTSAGKILWAFKMALKTQLTRLK